MYEKATQDPYCFKARANARNIVGQQDATLLGATCCERLHGPLYLLTNHES